MNRLPSLNPAGLFIDIGQSSVQALCGGDSFSFPIERGENGRLTDACREKLAAGLRGFLAGKGRTAGRSAFCAIGARGVSMRRLTLPASSREELQRVLRLQIESEFPLAPGELAWGSRPVGPPKTPPNGGPARQELLVVAVKKELLEEYAAVLAACGVAPLFTLAALARAELYPPPSGSGAVLDIGRAHSEWMSFDNGAPASIRIVPWGAETLGRLIQELPGAGPDNDGKPRKTAALAALADGIKPAPAGGKLYLTGEGARDPRLAPLLAGVLGGAVPCESLAPPPGAAPSAAIAGLIKSTGPNSASPPLILELNGGHEAARPGPPAVWKWAAAALLLALAALFFPYAEAILLKPSLEKKLAALQADRGRLATIDEELDFLKFLKQSQPPYLDTIYLLARSAPQGARLDGLSLSRHQEISIRLKMGNAQQVSDFRSKLIDSGWFSDVIVEEQAPSPDRRVTVRMTAALKPAESRKPIAPEPPGKKTDLPSLADSEPDFAMPPPDMMMPPNQPVMTPPARRLTPPPRASAPRGGMRITVSPGGQPMPVPAGDEDDDAEPTHP